MTIRNNERYKIQIANTERLRNSPVVYMQKLLNENENKSKS